MGESDRRVTREVGRGDAGGDNSKGCIGESGSSDKTSDAESEEGKEEPALLTASPWGTQESGERGLWVGGRSGRSGGKKTTSGTADGGETWRRHGAQTQHDGEREAAGVGRVTNPGEWGGNSGGREASVVGPDPL